MLVRFDFRPKPHLLQIHEIVEKWPKKDFWRSSELSPPYLWLVSIPSQLHPTCTPLPSMGPHQPTTGMSLLVETHLRSIIPTQAIQLDRDQAARARQSCTMETSTAG